MKSKSFWEKKEPIMALAPLSGVTDCAFREIIAEYAKPDILYTEFTSADGLCSRGKERLLLDLKFTEKQRPILAQIFGSNPDNFYQVAKLCVELGFDGIDINMGCPDKSVERQGAGSALIKNPCLAKELISACKQGANNLLPVSVKTRIGYNKDQLDEWLPHLLEAKPTAIAIHARTRNQLSLVPADWSKIKKAVDIAKGTGIPILGNGDVYYLAQAEQLCNNTGAKGVLFGRAIFGNPWFFSKSTQKKNLSFEKRLKGMLTHTYYFQKFFGSQKNFLIMRKHLSSYVKKFPNASKLREHLMGSTCLKDVQNICQKYLSNSKKLFKIYEK